MYFNNILVIGHRNIGDILFNLSVLKPLKTAFPRSNIIFLTSQNGAEFLKENPYISEIYIYKKDFKSRFQRIQHVLGLILKLRSYKFDVILNLKSGSLLHLFLRRNLTWRISSRNQQTETKRNKHAIDSYLDILEENGIKFSRKDIDLRIHTGPTEKNAVDTILKVHGYDSHKKTVVFVPFANWSGKEWSLQNYGELAKKVARECGIQVVFVGGPDDRPKMENIKTYQNYFIDLVGALTLRQLAALYEKAFAVVGGDTGPFHLASSVGAIPLCLFGATSHKRARPYFYPENVVIGDKDIGCNPCYPGKNPHNCKIYHETTPCMKDITLDKVFQKFLQVTQDDTST